jgi:hypothetical protein
MTKQHLLFYGLIILSVGVDSCAPRKSISTQKADTHEENVAPYRIRYADSLRQTQATVPNPERTLTVGPVATRYAITDNMDAYVAERSERNADKNTYQGYTLQVYTGGSRDEANEAKRRVYDALPDARPAINYNSSIYRVQVGEYTNRLEAQEDYTQLKKEFPYVLLVPQKFRVN